MSRSLSKSQPRSESSRSQEIPPSCAKYMTLHDGLDGRSTLRVSYTLRRTDVHGCAYMTCARTQTLSHAGRCDVERLGEQSSPCLIALFQPSFCLSNSVDYIQSSPQEWILRVTSMRIKLSLLKSHAAAATTKRHLTRNGVSICTPYSPCSTSPSLVSLYTSMRTLTVANGKLLAGIQNCMTHEAPSCMKSVHTLEPSHTIMRSNKPLKSTIAPFSSLGRRAHKLTMRGNISYTVRVER